MSRVMYGPAGGTLNRIIPAPLVNISKSYQKTGDGTIIGKLYTLTITGTIVAYMGSPMSDGSFHQTSGYPDDEDISSDERLSVVLKKQTALKNLFSLDGGQFEVQGADGGTSLRCYPRVNSIDFPEDIWYERSNYTIVLECDEIFGLSDDDTFDEPLQSVTEEWSIDTNEDPQSLGASTTYALSHSISAVGKTYYDEGGTKPFEPWQYAERYVLSRLGFDSVMAISSGVNNLPSYYNGWNHRRSSRVDKKGGEYSVTETWLLASGSAIEEFSINTNHSLEQPYDTVSIQGTVTGFEERNSDMEIVTSKWDNAKTKFEWASGVAFTRAQTYSNKNLNINPLSLVVGRNPLNGVIDYTFEYNTRPTNLIENAKSESIVISDNIGGELFASVFVLGREAGPVLQDLGTKPANTRILSIELVVDPPTYSDNDTTTIIDLLNNKKPSVDSNFASNLNNLISAANPTHLGATTIFQDQPQESWDIKSGRYSYSTTWTYE